MRRVLPIVAVVVALAPVSTGRAFRVPSGPRPPPRVFPTQPRVRPVPRAVPRRRSRPRRPQVREVRRALRRLVPLVQRCSDYFHPLPARGPRQRLRLRVWLTPDGRWNLEVPELAARDDRTRPFLERRGLLQLYACLNLAVARHVGPLARPFRGPRIKVERAYSVVVPTEPPPAAALSRRVRRRRRQLVACVPGTGLRGTQHELVIQARLGRDGTIALRGLGVPESVPFEEVARCVAEELGRLEHGRVTSERAFEAVLRYRLVEDSSGGTPADTESGD